MPREEEKNVLQRYDGRGVILKVKQTLPIDRMCFSFVQYGADNKATGSVDCFLDAADFGLLMERIRNNSLQKQIVAEKKRAEVAGEKYPKAIFTSPMGGKHTKDGAISRYFTIAPGMKADVVFTGYAFKAAVSKTGAFIPVKGEKPVCSIRVSTDWHGLALMAYKWQWLEKDYMTRKYNMLSMQDDYRKDGADGAGEVTPAPAAEQPAENFADAGDADVPFI